MLMAAAASLPLWCGSCGGESGESRTGRHHARRGKVIKDAALLGASRDPVSAHDSSEPIAMDDLSLFL
jgi:hypothetical protein